MPLTILAIGKKHEPWILEGIERYQKRLRQPFVVEWVLLPHSLQDGLSARQDESQRLLARLSDSYVVLLDERGTQMDSPSLSRLLVDQLQSSRTITLIIGGAYGVDQSVHDRADFVWSLSSLVFPHQLVRLLLIEQLYRAQTIAVGSPYHHK